MLYLFTRFVRGKASYAKSGTRTQVRLAVEELTPRIVPQAGGWGFGRFFDHLGPAIASAVSHACEYGGLFHTGNLSSTLATKLTNSGGASGLAFFNTTDGDLAVRVHGATPSSSLDVAINGTSVGSVSTNANGNGFTKVTTTGVTVTSGATITVGDLTGTLTQVKLSASLTGATGVSGNAVYSPLAKSLVVTIKGATANTTYDVSVDGNVVGQINATGKGKGILIQLPTSAAIQSGSTITVSTGSNPPILSGSFA